MTNRLNEKGYALLMVIMLVLLFTTLGMGMLAMNINASKQFNLKEEQVQARHQAEMGVLHYGIILEDKIKSSSTSSLSCNDIDAVLGTAKKLTVGNYIIEPANVLGSSCEEIENSKLLEITIKSKGIINGDTEKEVKATFYATNQGVSSTAPPAGIVVSPPTLPSSPDTEVKTILAMKKDHENFLGNLIIKDKLDIGGGNSDILKVNKDLYISGNIDIQNHACISAGGNFTALKSFNWGNSKTSLLVRKDAYLPSAIGNWQKNQVNAYIFGDLYLPQTYNYSVGKEADRNLFIGGKVYQLNSQGKYVVIPNPFKILSGQKVKDANNLPCTVPAAIEVTAGTPKWVLQDEKIVNYQ
ncbi:hypothetical protein [Planococcus shixiaomingii]|uniref:hypothetical protein n=1 Tax=Planococcus shixiaomingii TaxID=3058393 RepID=UPI00261A4404|nr:hypothetical protein [Planococcus sp. N022]WKA56195.1 hypothetical protein QWY21_07585 [Planococcus sp. N022]